MLSSWSSEWPNHRAEAWNGGVCGMCSERFLGSHQCSEDSLRRRIEDLEWQVERLRLQREELVGWPTAFAESCPCNPMNGGSGVCGCIMGGPQITC